MRTTAPLTNNDARRRSAVEFIQNTYAARYNARLEVFPSRITLFDDCEDILCAAGLRFLDDGFISERYLDVAIGDFVSAVSGRAVNRDVIFEVTMFASRAPLATAEFISEVGAFGEKAGEWSFFILTRRFHIVICQLGITP